MNPIETRFIVVRHGQTEWNLLGRWQGWEDSPLTELGKSQAVDAAMCLRENKLDAIYSSVSGRAIGTAQAIADDHGLTVAPVEALRERFAGDFEGLTTDEIIERFPGALFDPEVGPRDEWKPRNGETLQDVAARVKPFLLETAAKHPNQTVVLVTHSIVVRVMDHLATGHAWETTWDRAPVNCCVFEIAVDEFEHIRVVNHHHDSYCEVP